MWDILTEYFRGPHTVTNMLYSTVKDKDKFHPITCHEGTEGE